MLGGATLSHAKTMPSFKPAMLPEAQSGDADIGSMSVPQAPMAQPVAPPPALSPEMLLEGLSAIKGSRDGSQTTIEPPSRVQQMLMNKQEGMIGGTDKDKDKKKTGGMGQIGNTAQYPYSTIGVIASGCTGAVVMKRFVLTAAWCVFDLKNKKFYENLDFYPAMNGKQTPFGKVAWKNVWVAKGFAEKGDLNFGYGLIELNEDIGDKIGWFGFGDVPKFNFKQLTLTGYPFAVVPPQTMWETKCAIQGAEENAIFYRCPGDNNALAAMLGSLMWFKGKADDAWQIVGIHITSQNEQKNSWWASRLSRAHTETILSWASAADQTDQGKDDQTDQGTDDQTNDDNGTDTAGPDNPPCTCDQQGSAQ
jgi:V8-like Glu-specific endopeptidase